VPCVRLSRLTVQYILRAPAMVIGSTAVDNTPSGLVNEVVLGMI
jgi:hypothetical protein